MAQRGLEEEASLEADADRSNLASLATYLKTLGNAKRLHLLDFLARPHYLEEIAKELHMARQTAQEHVQRLLDIGVVKRVRGRREQGPVTDYVVVPHRLFGIHEEMGRLGTVPVQFEDTEPVRALTQPMATGASFAGETAAPRLVIVHGMRIGRSISLTGTGPWLLGRDPHAAACLDYDPFVSNRHAEVRKVPGGYDLADLYSSNGTYVDWRRVPRGDSRRLENGMVVRVGRSLLLYRQPSPA